MFYFLAEVFRKIINNSLKNHALCPSHYLITPGLSWDAMLKTKQTELGLMSDLEVYIFFTTKDWIFDISNRFIIPNNKYLKSYYPKQELKHIIWLGTNNLHGCTMSKFLPISRFKWIVPEGFDLNNYTINSSKRCVLKVDLEYLKNLHELHNYYPLAPDKIEIKIEMFSTNDC